jgi:hypothetical protein
MNSQRSYNQKELAESFKWGYRDAWDSANVNLGIFTEPVASIYALSVASVRFASQLVRQVLGIKNWRQLTA